MSHSTKKTTDETASTALRWNNDALDELCRMLPDFGACVITLEDASDLELAWTQAEAGLIPNAKATDLKAMRAEWKGDAPETLADEIRDDLIDLLVLRSDDTTVADLNLLCRRTATFPCALIALTRVVPPEWRDTFDISVVISRGTARIQKRGDNGKPFEIPCTLQGPRQATRAPAAPPRLHSSGPRVSAKAIAFGIDPKLKDSIQSALGADIVELKTDAHAIDRYLPCPLLLVSTSTEIPAVHEAIHLQNKSGAAWIALGRGSQRDEDPAKLYLAGARTVLSRHASVDEILAAVRASLPGFEPILTPVDPVESDIERALAHVPKNKIWKLSELNDADGAYRDVIDHQIKLAKRSGTSLGGLIIDLPGLPQGIAGTGWSNLFHGAVLGMLSSSLRGRDVSFLLETSMIVLSPNMSHIVGTAIVKRIEALMPSTPLAERWRIVKPAQVDEPSALIRTVFQDVRAKSGRSSS